MKKIFFAGASTLLVLSVVFYFNVSSGQTVLAKLLPSETILYMEQQDLSASIEFFVESRFGKVVLGLDVGAIAKDLKLTDQKRTALKEEFNHFKELLDDPLLHQLFGQKAVLALLPAPSNAQGESIDKQIVDRLVVVAQPKQSTKIIEKIADVYSGKDDITTSSYGDFKIYKIENGSQTISVAIVDDLLIMALEEGQLRLCLDVYDNQKPSLQQNEDYQYHRALYTDINRFAYLSMDSLRDDISKVKETFAPVVAQIVEDEMQTAAGVSSVSYSGWRATDAYEDKIVARYILDQVSDTLRHQLTKKPSSNSSKTWIPSDVVGYYWTNTLDLELLWQLYSDDETGVPWLSEIEQNFQNITGEDLVTVLADIGAEASFLMKPGQENQLIPVPEIACFLKTGDSELLDSIITKLIQQYGLPMLQEKYKDVSYHYLGMRLQGDLQPVYGFYKGFLIFTTSPKMFENIIETSLGDDRLIDSEQFKTVDTGLAENNNGYGYLQVEHFLKESEKVLRWSNTMLAIQDGQKSAQAGQLLDHLVLPLLDGLMMYTESSSRSYFSKDSVIIESRTTLTNQ